MFKHFYFNIIAVLIISSFSSLISFSQAAIMMKGKLSYSYNTNPGNTITGTIELRNAGKEAAEVKFYQEDARINKDGKVEFVATGGTSHSRSNATWVRLNTDRIVLPAGKSQTVVYTIDVPNDSKLKGSYWSVIHVEPVSKKSPESQLAQQSTDKDITFRIQQKMRYAIQIRTHIGTDNKANLVFSAPNIDKNAQGKRHFYIDIENTNIQYSRPEFSLDVFDKKGNLLKKLEGKSRGLYPQAKKTFTVNISALAPGQYKGLIAAEDDFTGQVFGSDINLTVNP